MDGGSEYQKRFSVFPISGPIGSGKPDASIQGESLGQEASNDTSSMRIGPAVPPTLPLITPILIRYNTFNNIFSGRKDIYLFMSISDIISRVRIYDMI